MPQSETEPGTTPALAALDLPFETIPMEIGGRMWQIRAVHDQEALLGVTDRVGTFPFGLLLWDSAPVLADALAARGPSLGGQRVLELGAGVGLVGLVARHLGAEVRQTDHAAECLAVAEENARRNGIKGIDTALVDWRQWSDRTLYDLIVGSDILYEPDGIDALLAIFEGNLAPGGRVLLSDPRRMHTAAFLERMSAAGWSIATGCRVVPALMPLQVAETVEVMVIEARRGGDAPAGRSVGRIGASAGRA